MGALLSADPDAAPHLLIERATKPGRSIGPLAGALEDFFTERGLAMLTDHNLQAAAARRTRRVSAVPPSLRPAVEAFEKSMLTERDRSRRAGTRPRTDNTIERRLADIRSLAIYLSANGIEDWSQTDRSSIENFLVRQGKSSTGALSSCRRFFAFARRRKLILIDPTTELHSRNAAGFTGRTVPLDRQRDLFARWAHGNNVHPNEALAGLLALVHGTSASELRSLLVTDVDHTRHSIRLGRRPHPTPLDPDSWGALTTCLEHRSSIKTDNPHVVVTRGTRARHDPASTPYISHLLDPAGTTMRELRSSRLIALTNTQDPNLVATAYGMSAEGVLAYFADRVDPSLLANL